jgi:hypothetical protein
MAVKVIMKGKAEVPDKTKPAIPRIAPPPKKGNFFIFTLLKRMFRIMLMDLQMILSPELRKEYEDYRRFTELARRKP